MYLHAYTKEHQDVKGVKIMYLADANICQAPYHYHLRQVVRLFYNLRSSGRRQHRHEGSQANGGDKAARGKDD